MEPLVAGAVLAMLAMGAVDLLMMARRPVPAEAAAADGDEAEGADGAVRRA